MKKKPENKDGKTKVVFYIEGDLISGKNVLAVFPEEKYASAPKSTDIVCYAQLGQHSGVSLEYAKRLPKAAPVQYANLRAELESIGYNLQILNEQ